MRTVKTTYETIRDYSIIGKVLPLIDKYSFLEVSVYQEEVKSLGYTNEEFYGYKRNKFIEYRLTLEIEGSVKTTADLIGELENL